MTPENLARVLVHRFEEMQNGGRNQRSSHAMETANNVRNHRTSEGQNHSAGTGDLSTLATRLEEVRNAVQVNAGHTDATSRPLESGEAQSGRENRDAFVSRFLPELSQILPLVENTPFQDIVTVENNTAERMELSTPAVPVDTDTATSSQNTTMASSSQTTPADAVMADTVMATSSQSVSLDTNSNQAMSLDTNSSQAMSLDTSSIQAMSLDTSSSQARSLSQAMALDTRSSQAMSLSQAMALDTNSSQPMSLSQAMSLGTSSSQAMSLDTSSSQAMSLDASIEVLRMSEEPTPEIVNLQTIEGLAEGMSVDASLVSLSQSLSVDSQDMSVERLFQGVPVYPFEENIELEVHSETRTREVDDSIDVSSPSQGVPLDSVIRELPLDSPSLGAPMESPRQDATFDSENHYDNSTSQNVPVEEGFLDTSIESAPIVMESVGEHSNQEAPVVMESFEEDSN